MELWRSHCKAGIGPWGPIPYHHDQLLLCGTCVCEAGGGGHRTRVREGQAPAQQHAAARARSKARASPVLKANLPGGPRAGRRGCTGRDVRRAVVGEPLDLGDTCAMCRVVIRDTQPRPGFHPIVSRRDPSPRMLRKCPTRFWLARVLRAEGEASFARWAHRLAPRDAAVSNLPEHMQAR